MKEAHLTGLCGYIRQMSTDATFLISERKCTPVPHVIKYAQVHYA